MAPRVSVCIPAYNHARFLAAAIESALAQTYGDLEVIVCDNASNDDTADIVRSIVAGDQRVRYERALRHVGMAENFNRAISLARGTFVKLLCSDDVLEPECVERLLRALEHADAVLAGCARRFMDESLRSTLTIGRFSGRNWAGPGTEAARRVFYHGNVIGEPTAVIFRRSAFERFEARYSQLVDLDVWLRMLERGRFAFVAEPLCRIRMHAGQATGESVSSSALSKDKRQLFRDYARRAHMRGSLAERLLWDFRFAWSARREPGMGAANDNADALFYPALWRAMRFSAAVASRLRKPLPV